MPANTSPEYKKAEAAYRRARDPAEKLDLLREMLRTIPKHKGTEHMRADIKTRIKELSDATTSSAGGARSGPATVVRPEGAAQIALIGPPNSGKSALHARLTGSHTAIGDYPFTTQFPQPGMLEYEDVQIQLVDLPAISPEHPIPWIANAIQTADGCLLVVDLAHPGCLAETVQMQEQLADRRIHLTSDWPGSGTPAPPSDDPFATAMPTLLVTAKSDLLEDPAAEVDVFEDLTGCGFDWLAVSVREDRGLEELADAIWSRLGVVRVYTKIPGQSADMDRPFTLRQGDTVHDVAQLVHRDIASAMRFARVWNGDEFDGRQVGPDHVLADGEIVELHL
ncbi:MAG TPA: GTPase [Acidimicrobiia bacterium]|nr:GTPase [Acidimicrobiia bacterium]